MCIDSSAFVDVHTPAHEISIIITEEGKKNQLCLLFSSLTRVNFLLAPMTIWFIFSIE